MTEKDKMPTDYERPLITFMLLSYNQECFIADAVAGAFAQTYRPLEILLTDDCSTDRTFDIASEMAASYRGPHRIVLNRNRKNLGIGAHVNHAVELAQGALIVAAAGDDVSLPERTETMFEHWQAADVRPDSLFSDAYIVDGEGRRSGRLFAAGPPEIAGSAEEAATRGKVGVAGCTHVFSKRTFDTFGPMDPEVIAEDMVIPFRSLLASGVRFVDAPLVEYRVHGRNMSATEKKKLSCSRRKLESENKIAVLQTWLNDVRCAQAAGSLTPERGHRLKELIVADYHWSFLEWRIYSSSLPGALAGFLHDSLKRLGRILDRRRRTDG